MGPRLGLSPLSLGLLSCPRWASPGQADHSIYSQDRPLSRCSGAGIFPESDLGLRLRERMDETGVCPLLSCQCHCPGQGPGCSDCMGPPGSSHSSTLGLRTGLVGL